MDFEDEFDAFEQFRKVMDDYDEEVIEPLISSIVEIKHVFDGVYTGNVDQEVARQSLYELQSAIIEQIDIAETARSMAFWQLAEAGIIVNVAERSLSDEFIFNFYLAKVYIDDFLKKLARDFPYPIER